MTPLLDLLFNYQHYESITRELKHFYQEVTAQLEAIIFFLQKSYGCYFNTNQNLPISLRLREGHEVKRQWKTIAKTLGDTETNMRLETILDQSIKGLLHHNEETAVTYHQVSYFKNLLKEISGYLSTSGSSPAYASITELLISWKFNDFAFIQEVCTGIRAEVEKKESDEFRIEFLRNCQKQVGQLFEKNNLPFHTVQPTAKQIILDWITQEIAYLELVAIVPETKDVKEAAAVKIHTSLSVPVLALLARLLKDGGIFTNPNQSEILKFFTAHFTTQRKSEFSYGHLHSKYYQVDESTKKKVYDHLMVMAQLCKKL